MKRTYTEIVELKGFDLIGLNDFLISHKGKTAEITAKIINPDKPGHYQHKYYRGFLLSAIAHESFSDDLFAAHVYLKSRFLKIHCGGFDEIPEKYKSSKTMFLFDGEELTGYIPSTADITHDEFKQFIKQVDGLLLDIQVSMSQDEAELRQKALLS